MSLNKKIYMVQQNREPAIAALDGYLDYIYSLHEMFFNEDNTLKEGLTHDARAEDLIISSKNNAEVFEKIRRKLKDGDFNLSLLEINYIGLAFFFTSSRMRNRIKELETSIREIDDLVAILMEGADKETIKVIEDTSNIKVIDSQSN